MTQRIHFSMLDMTGVVIDYIGATAPEGWTVLDGRTIGKAGSGATNRANNDTEALFTLLWNSLADAQAAVSGGRGASAAADFAAGKTIAVPDCRGRVIAGLDDGGAGRLTTARSGVDGAVLGSSGGVQDHTLTISQLPAHGHPFQLSVNTASPASSTTTGGFMLNTNSSSSRVAFNGPAGNTAGEQIGGTGNGSAHSSTQPTIVMNKIIKL